MCERRRRARPRARSSRAPVLPSSGLSRRRLLQGMVALAGLAGLSAALAACTSEQPRPPSPRARGRRTWPACAPTSSPCTCTPPPPRGPAACGRSWPRPAANGFDVAWFTEHDWRRDRLLFRPSFSFVPDEVVMGGRWGVPAEPPDGSVTADSGGELVEHPGQSERSLPCQGLAPGARHQYGRRPRHRHPPGRTPRRSRGRTTAPASPAARSRSTCCPPPPAPTDGGRCCFRLSRHPCRGRPAARHRLAALPAAGRHHDPHDQPRGARRDRRRPGDGRAPGSR